MQTVEIHSSFNGWHIFYLLFFLDYCIHHVNKHGASQSGSDSTTSRLWSYNVVQLTVCTGESFQPYFGTKTENLSNVFCLSHCSVREQVQNNCPQASLLPGLSQKANHCIGLISGSPSLYPLYIKWEICSANIICSIVEMSWGILSFLYILLRRSRTFLSFFDK